MNSMSSIPDWAWIALAIGAAVVAYRNGWLDKLLSKPAAIIPPQPQAVNAQLGLMLQQIMAAQQTSNLTSDVIAESQPVLERISLKGPVKILVSGGKVDVTA